MRHTRLKLAVAGLLLSPLLVACAGTDKQELPDRVTPEAKPGQPGSQSAGAEATGAAEPATDGPSVDPGQGTVAKDSLTPVQADLYDDLMLFEAVAQAEAGDGFGMKSGSFDSGDLEAPEGTKVATSFYISWGGDDVDYSLATDSGEELSWSDGTVYLDLSVDSPEDQELVQSATSVEQAITEWRGQYGEIPSVSSGFDGVTLNAGMLDDYQATEVEVPLGSGVSYAGYSSTDEEFRVILESSAGEESATITQDGISFFRSLSVV